MSAQKAPKVFAIGLPYSGGRAVADLFLANGYRWAHYKQGKLLQDIAYAKISSTAPLGSWPNVAGFSGLHDANKRHLPHLQLADHLEFLLVQFPDAYFIHTRPDIARWIAERMSDNEHCQTAAFQANCQIADLPDLWRQEAAHHMEVCLNIFKGHDRFLNVEDTPQATNIITEFLNAEFDLQKHSSTRHNDTKPPPIQTKELPQIPPADANFVAQVVDFCKERAGPNGKPQNLSPTAIVVTSDSDISDKKGNAVRLKPRSDGTYLLHPAHNRIERAQATLNEALSHGACAPFQIDMMDARFLGSKGRRHAPSRTLAYNRRAGATNLTLWPLAGYHSLAPRDHPGGFPSDQIPFEEKEDRCVWLGNITGRMSPVFAKPDQDLRSVYSIRDQMTDQPTDETNWRAIIEDLSCVPRYNLVKRLRYHPDFEVGLVLRGAWAELSKSPAFKALSVPKQPRTWFHKFRYILSLAGNDTGSNFLSAASSNALILKEEDGWELFYTDAFKPWVHYVPLDEGALDVEEKLAWARAHPDAAKSMSDAATALYDKFANPNNRALILRGIAENLSKS